jgi:hypothetical protein
MDRTENVGAEAMFGFCATYSLTDFLGQKAARNGGKTLRVSGLDVIRKMDKLGVEATIRF